MLETRDVHQYYGSSHTLRGTSLTVPEGTCTVVMGRNGVGKTTLLRAIMGLVPLRSGSVKFGDRELVGEECERARARRDRLRPAGTRDLRAAHGGGEPARSASSRVATANRRFRSSCSACFPVLKTMMHRRGGDLSGGQQQQLAIARALTIGPKCVLLDEPTEGIQPNIVHEIGNVIRRLYEEEKLAVLLVEQKLPFARKVAERFFLMERGAVVASGKMADLTDELVQKHLAV